jgi:hypothetical protein
LVLDEALERGRDDANEAREEERDRFFELITSLRWSREAMSGKGDATLPFTTDAEPSEGAMFNTMLLFEAWLMDRLR